MNTPTMTNDDDDKKAARAARVAADMRETEDLLAGFDRPGRTPRTPPVRDFVDYHMKKERSDPNAGRARDAAAVPIRADAPKRVPEPTFLIPRKKTQLPTWLPWLALLLAMPAAGGLVAYCTLSSDGARGGAASSSPSLPSAATTISAASSPTTGAAERDIPPPAPLDTLSPTTVSSTIIITPAAPPPPSTSPSALLPTQTRPSSNGQPASSSSSDPRVDFIRHL